MVAHARHGSSGNSLFGRHRHPHCVGFQTPRRNGSGSSRSWARYLTGGFQNNGNKRIAISLTGPRSRRGADFKLDPLDIGRHSVHVPRTYNITAALSFQDRLKRWLYGQGLKHEMMISQFFHVVHQKMPRILHNSRIGESGSNIRSDNRPFFDHNSVEIKANMPSSLVTAWPFSLIWSSQKQTYPSFTNKMRDTKAYEFRLCEQVFSSDVASLSLPICEAVCH